MAPKKPSISKKQKTTVAGSSGTWRNFDPVRFLGPEQQEHFEELEKRQIRVEKKFDINPNGDYAAIQAIIDRRRWDKLLDPPEKLNYDFVREFYAIGDQPFTFTTMVRGHQIQFDRDAIHSYLGRPFCTYPADVYSETLARGNWPIQRIAPAIFAEGRSFQLNAAGEPIRVLRKDLTTPAQVILLWILYNLKPRTHNSTATMEIVGLLYYILANVPIDIAKVISTEMKGIAESGIKNNADPVLAYPGLIMGLCAKGRVKIPPHVSKVIMGQINDIFIARFCKPPRPEQAPQQPEQQQQPHLGAYPAMDPQFQTWFYHLADQNTSNHRAMISMQEQMYNQQFMEPHQYQTYVAWPGDRPNFGEGASNAAEVAADDDGDEEDTHSDGDAGDDDGASMSEEF